MILVTIDRISKCGLKFDFGLPNWLVRLVLA